jgi:hypothetical protein
MNDQFPPFVIGGVRYPEGMSPFKAGSLLFKMASQKSKGKGKGNAPSKKGGASLAKSVVRQITSIKK